MVVGLAAPEIRAGSVVTDGSVGPAQTLAGPNFAVTANLGRQVGSNLFHSFSDFQLSPGDTATFSGPNAGPPVTNILARVTGGGFSNISGTIRSTIPGANFYLINPAGVIFGPNAQLDVSGSFIVSTADVVKLAGGGSFNASHPVDSLLTSAAPAAFGFLNKPPLSNGANGQGEVDVVGQSASAGGNPAALDVATGKSISIVAGNILFLNAVASAPSGNINLASVSGSGDVKVNPADPGAAPDTSGVSALGFVGLRTGLLTVDGAPGGRVSIRCGSMLMDTNSTITSDTSGGGTGGGVDISVTGLLTVGSGGGIFSTSSGSTPGGPLTINTGNLSLDNSALSSSEPLIETAAAGSGKGGNLQITTGGLSLDGPGFIIASTTANGPGGSLLINAQQISVTGNHAFIGAVSTAASGGGPTGDITIVTQQLSLTDSAQIFVSGTGVTGTGSAVIGSVNVQAKSITLSGSLSGISVHGVSGSLTVNTDTLSMDQGSSIDTATFSANNAGTISINAKSISAKNDSTITASTGEQTTGNGASLSITADSLTLDTSSAIASSTLGSGPAGVVTLNVGQLTLSTLSDIGTFSGGGGGRGGNIDVQATSVIAQSGAFFNASTINSGDGGNISIVATHVLLDGPGSGIKAPAVTAGANGVTGSGGNVTVKASDLTIQNGAEIRSSAESRAGDGSPDPVAALTGSSGPAGAINVNVDKLRIVGDSTGKGSGIFSQTSLQKPGTGPAGSIAIHAKQMTVLPGGNISTSTSGPGDAGTVAIRAGHLVIGHHKSAPNSATITSASTGTGNAGSVSIHTTDSTSLRAGGTVGVSATASSAGDVTIRGGHSLTVNHSLVTARSSTTGGNITLDAQDAIRIRNSTVTAQAGGNGGKIFIDPSSVVLQGSTINGLSGGKAVDVQIVSDGFLQSGSRILTNTNEQFPVSDIAGSIANLGTNLITGAAQLQPQCGVRFTQQSVSSFVVTGRGGEPPEAGSWIPDLDLQSSGTHR